MRYIEIAARTWPLRFTARAILRTQQITNVPFRENFTRGEEGARTLLYCALCDAFPAITRRKANALFDALLPDVASLYDLLARAYDDSGFPREGITQQQFDRLLSAAARAGMQDTVRLYDLSYREIIREADAFLARAGAVTSAPMTDQQMLSTLKIFARRSDHANP